MTTKVYSVEQILKFPAISTSVGDCYIIYNDEGVQKIVGKGKWTGSDGSWVSISPEDKVIDNYLQNEPFWIEHRVLMKDIGGMKFSKISGGRIPKFSDEDDSSPDYYKFSIVGCVEHDLGICYNSKDLVFEKGVV